jgi:hypothetical protein
MYAIHATMTTKSRTQITSMIDSRQQRRRHSNPATSNCATASGQLTHVQVAKSCDTFPYSGITNATNLNSATSTLSLGTEPRNCCLLIVPAPRGLIGIRVWDTDGFCAVFCSCNGLSCRLTRVLEAASWGCGVGGDYGHLLWYPNRTELAQNIGN